jgi:hypothetical protein
MFQNINVIREKNHRILSIDVEKAFDEIQHPFMKKTLKKVGIGVYLDIIKAIHGNLIANIVLNREKPKAFLLKSGMSHFSTLTQYSA